MSNLRLRNSILAIGKGDLARRSGPKFAIPKNHGRPISARPGVNLFPTLPTESAQQRVAGRRNLPAGRLLLFCIPGVSAASCRRRWEVLPWNPCLMSSTTSRSHDAIISGRKAGVSASSTGLRDEVGDDRQGEKLCDLLGGAKHIACITTEIAPCEPGDKRRTGRGGNQALKPACR